MSFNLFSGLCNLFVSNIQYPVLLMILCCKIITKTIWIHLVAFLVNSALVSRSSGLSSSPGRGHCTMFLGEILDSHSASLHSGV